MAHADKVESGGKLETAQVAVEVERRGKFVRIKRKENADGIWPERERERRGATLQSQRKSANIRRWVNNARRIALTLMIKFPQLKTVWTLYSTVVMEAPFEKHVQFIWAL